MPHSVSGTIITCRAYFRNCVWSNCLWPKCNNSCLSLVLGAIPVDFALLIPIKPFDWIGPNGNNLIPYFTKTVSL